MLEKGTVVFGNWTVEERIGSGAFGTVYKIKREDFDEEYVAAMKVIRIPQDGDEKGRLHSEGMNDTDISLYYKQIAKDFIKEIKLLSSLDGVTNIVDYKDHVIETNDDLGYTIYIKMQLLTPVNKLLVDESNNAKFLSNEDILKLGKDMCSALEVCERKRIIHRDIKIDNIFISEDGDYKLGDFGIARQLEATQGEMSKKGTLMYMAPEVFKGEKYDRTADIYSLGIVLYRLLNKNRAPFFPDYPQTIKFTDKEEANNRRLNGDEVPDIIGISAELNAVLKKACAYNPLDRYQSASDFKAALEGVRETIVASVIPEFEDEKTELVFAETPNVAPISEDTADEATVGIFDNTNISENTIDEEQTEAVVKDNLVDEAVLSDTFFEKDTVTLVRPEEDEKTETAFSLISSKQEPSNEDESKREPKKKKKQGDVSKERNALILLCVLLLFTICSVIAISKIPNKTTTPPVDSKNTIIAPSLNSEGYYELYTADDLFWFAEEVNSGRNPSANAILMNDIDLNPGYIFSSDGTVTYNGEIVTDGWRSWEPIGFEKPSSNMHYTGTFDGNGYTVSGVYFNNEERYAVGFFGYTDGATIKNLDVENAYINGYSSVGGIVGRNYGTVEYCTNSGVVSGDWSYIGGVVGYNWYGTIASCSNSGVVSGNWKCVGGVAGDNWYGTVESCSNSGVVNGKCYIGGVVGLNYGTVDSCTNSGVVSGVQRVGGVVGCNDDGTVGNCTNSGDVIGSDVNGVDISGLNRVGGVVGMNYGTVESCTNSGVVSGNWNCVGGIVGCNYAVGYDDNDYVNNYAYGTVENCTNSGAVSGKGYVGGVVGDNISTVESCTNSGSVSGTANVGGVVGENSGTISDCSYYSSSADCGIGYCDDHNKYNCTSHGVTTN